MLDTLLKIGEWQKEGDRLWEDYRDYRRYFGYKCALKTKAIKT